MLGALLREDPNNPLFTDKLAFATRNLGRSADELVIYGSLIRNRPNYWPAHNEIGWSLYRLGKTREAAKAFAEAAALAPQVALPLANLGSMYYALGDRAAAAEAFRRSLALSKNRVALINLGSIYLEQGNAAMALTQFTQALDMNPRDEEAWASLGDCQQKLGNLPAMRAGYGKAAGIVYDRLKINPQLGRERMKLAFYDAKAAHLTEVLTNISEAERAGALDVISQFLKARSLALLGKLQEATDLVIKLLGLGLSPVEVELAAELTTVRSDPRYKLIAEQRKNQ